MATGTVKWFNNAKGVALFVQKVKKAISLRTTPQYKWKVTEP